MADTEDRAHPGSQPELDHWRTWRWQNRAALLSGIVLLLIAAALLTYMYDERLTRSRRQPQILPACELGPSAIVSEVDRAVTVDVLVGNADACNKLVNENPVPIRIGSWVRIGSRVQVQLTSKTFPGRVELLGAETQFVDKYRPWAQWTWEILADRPGEYDLSLIVSTVDEDGSAVEYQNFRREVKITVASTLDYTINSILRALDRFLTSVAGILTSVGVIAAAAGGLIWRHRRSNTNAGKPRLEGSLRSRRRLAKTSTIRRSSRPRSSSIVTPRPLTGVVNPASSRTHSQESSAPDEASRRGGSG